ncbi:diguanylate cyclase [Thermomonas flagellata]|uniref:diguanylate cyclase n=1 Tax=Thermomonas flagellata TaxID=2888524 RepID=UPI001F04FC71|nr:diguanylate cyclase [Thermomonas flagellata]
MSRLRHWLHGLGLAALLLPMAGLAWYAETGGAGEPTDAVPVQVQSEHAVGDRLRYRAAQARPIEAELHFRLPEQGNERWVLWLSRDVLDSVIASAPGWSPPPQGLHHPEPGEFLPSGYAFPLPAAWRGERRVHLTIAAGVRAAPHPRVISERAMLRLLARDRTIVAAVYAALLTLAVAALALYAAVRDRIFLWFAAYAGGAWLLALAVNGHLHLLVPSSWLALLAGGGSWFMLIGFGAVGLVMVLRYARPARALLAPLARVSQVYAALAVLSLVVPVALAEVVGWVATLSWMVALVLAIALVYGAARRRQPMAVPLLLALGILAATGVAHELMQAALLPDNAWTRYGYQVALVLVSLLLFVGLSSRIGEVRARLEVEAGARRLSEQRLRREQVRADLAPALQAGLAGIAEAAIAPTAFRLLTDAAQRLLGCGEAVVVAHGCFGDPGLRAYGADPASAAARMAMGERTALHALAQAGVPRLVHLSRSQRYEPALHAVVPLALPAPAWGALVVRLPPGCEPDAAELDALDGMARLAVLHAQEAFATAQLRRSADRDALTGVPNRSSLDRMAQDAFAACQRRGLPLSVLFIDLDWFKPINDQYGHAAGDLCLREVAQALSAQLRPGDVLGRYGGEEFLVVLPGSDAAAARVLAERLRQTIERRVIEWEGRRIPVTASIGLAGLRDGDPDLRTLLARADKALYQAKREGRNCVRASSAYGD